MLAFLQANSLIWDRKLNENMRTDLKINKLWEDQGASMEQYTVSIIFDI